METISVQITYFKGLAIGLAISFVYVYIWSPKISDCILYILEVNRWIKTRKYSRFDSSMQSRLLKKHLW